MIKFEMFCKRHKALVVLIVLLLLLITALLTGALIMNYNWNHAFDKNRPETATYKPDVSADITGVNFKLIERECRVDDILLGKTALQMMYGYCKDGVWTYVPCENYDLIGIFENEGEFGYDAAKGSHIVKIGDYLLISASIGYNQSEVRAVVNDTRDSQIVTMHEYLGTSLEEFVYLKEKGLLIGTKEYDFEASMPFLNKRYCLVDMTDLSEDYKFTVRIYHAQDGEESLLKEQTLTYDEIQRLLGVN